MKYFSITIKFILWWNKSPQFSFWNIKKTLGNVSKVYDLKGMNLKIKKQKWQLKRWWRWTSYNLKKYLEVDEKKKNHIKWSFSNKQKSPKVETNKIQKLYYKEVIAEVQKENNNSSYRWRMSYTWSSRPNASKSLPPQIPTSSLAINH